VFFVTRNWFVKAAGLTLAISLLAGCGGAKPTTPSTPTTPAATPAPEAKPAAKAFKVGMSTDVGGLNDDSFNAAAWRGLKKLESDLKFEVKAVESQKQDQYETNFRALMDQNFDLIWGIGFLMTDATDKVAKQTPNQKFAIIDSVVGQPNVASVVFKEEEGSFLMGIMAAKTTKTKQVGFVGGMESDVITHFEEGFMAGVKATDPTVKVISVYANSFTDSAKGKQIAQQMFSQSVDVVFHASGAVGQGVIEAAKEANKLAIGVDSDQNKLAPNNVISSMMKRVDVAVFNVSKAAQDGKFPGGKTTILGLKEDGVGYSPSTLWDKMPADTKALVEKWSTAIKDGKVTVPSKKGEAATWKAPTL
jgi:basic membrane protein A and related proteins